MNEILLKTSALTKKFKNYAAVNQVSLTINRGEIYGFIGRNGAGKTTFLKMVSGLTFPTNGKIELFGEDCGKNPNLFNRIGVLIEAPGLYGGMTAFQNLKAKCIAYGIADDNYIENLLGFVGLSDTGKKKTKNFSLGMKQRLGIAMALIGDPDLLVLDEPINGLDPQGIVEVRDTILKLNKEKNITIIISSHILEELSKIASKYGIIHEGKLIQELTKEELLNRCSEHIEIKTAQTREACAILEETLNIHNYKVVDTDTIHIQERLQESGTINMTLAAKGIQVNSINTTCDDLETYFLNLTGGVRHA
jgi:ABC-2 type transport system ATP-binding protein